MSLGAMSPMEYRRSLGLAAKSKKHPHPRFGLFFGWLYRKYGIKYAIMGHALLHIVSKTVRVVFR